MRVLKKLPSIGVGISHIIVVREEQSMKHCVPKLVTDEGILIYMRDSHPLKQSYPKLFTDDGMLIEAREKQSVKQQSPILVIDDDSGMSTDVRE